MQLAASGGAEDLVCAASGLYVFSLGKDSSAADSENQDKERRPSHRHRGRGRAGCSRGTALTEVKRST